LCREVEDRRGIAGSLNNLGGVAYEQGDYARAKALLGESVALYHELGDTWGIAAALDNLGAVTYAQGDYERARVLHEESLAFGGR